MIDPQGQIILDSERGRLLKQIIHEYNPKKIVEIGTWKGLGSTKVPNQPNSSKNFVLEYITPSIAPASR